MLFLLKNIKNMVDNMVIYMVIFVYKVGGKRMKTLFRFMKRADKTMNRIIIPKFIIEKYGRDFYLDVLEDGTMKLIPIKK